MSSYQKKSAILQQLQQAIKRKVNQKSKVKEQTKNQNSQQLNKVIQSSIQKKKQSINTNLNPNKQSRQNRVISSFKTKQNKLGHSEIDNVKIPVSVFNQTQQSYIMTQSNQLKHLGKKCCSRKWQKLISLVNYMISSSDKAIKFISSSNFQAQFAIKLFKSDKENLINQIKNFNLEELVNELKQQNKSEKTNNLSKESFDLLYEQNLKLKKEIVLLEKQAQRFHSQNISVHLKDSHSGTNTFKSSRDYDFHQTLLKQIIQEKGLKQIQEIFSKEVKFSSMIAKCKENDKKLIELNQILSALKKQKIQIFSSSLKQQILIQINSQNRSVVGLTSRSNKIKQIYNQKQLLQKQIQNLKNQLFSVKNIDKIQHENSLLKKNHQILYQLILKIVKKVDSQLFEIIDEQNQSNTKILQNKQTILETIENYFIESKRQLNSRSQRVHYLQEQNENVKIQLQRMLDEKQRLIDEYSLFRSRAQNDLLQYKNQIQSLQHDLNNLQMSRQREVNKQKQDQIRLNEDQFKQQQNMKKQLVQQKNRLQVELRNLLQKNKQVEYLFEENIQKLNYNSKRIQDLQNQLYEKQRLILEKEQSLQNIQQLKQQLTQRFSLSIDKLNDQIEKLEKEIQIKNNQVSQFMKIRQITNIKLIKLQRQLNQKDEKIFIYEKRLNELEQRLQQMDGSVDLVERLKREYQNNINRLKDDFNQQMSDYRIQIIKSKDLLAKLQQEKSQIDIENVKLNEKITMLELQKHQLINQFKKLKSQNQFLEHHIQQLNNQKLSLQQTNKQLTEKLNQNLIDNQIKTKYTQLVKTCDSIQKNNKRLQQQNQNLFTEQNALKNKLEQHQKIILQLNNQIGEIKFLNQNLLSQLQQVKQEKTILQRQILQSRNSDKITQFQQNEQKLKNLTQIHLQLSSQLQHFKSQQQNLSGLYEQLHHAHNELIGQLNQKNQQLRQIRSLLAEKQIQLQEKLKLIEQKDQQLNEKLQDKDLQIQQKQTQLIESINLLQEMKKSIQQIQSKNCKEQTIQQLQSQLHKIKQEYQNQLIKKQQQIQVYEIKIKNLSIKIIQLQSQRNQLIKQQEHFSNQLNKQKKANHYENQSIKIQLNKIKQQLKIKNYQCLKLTQNINEIQSTVNQLQFDIMNLNKLLNTKAVTISTLQTQILNKQYQIKSLSSQLQTISVQSQNKQQNKTKQIQIHQLKIKQYLFFIKKILQSTNIEFDDLKQENDLDRLLAVGSQRLLQIKKKLREEESNRKKLTMENNIMETFNQQQLKINEFQQQNQQNDSLLPVKLFTKDKPSHDNILLVADSIPLNLQSIHKNEQNSIDKQKQIQQFHDYLKISGISNISHIYEVQALNSAEREQRREQDQTIINEIMMGQDNQGLDHSGEQQQQYKQQQKNQQEQEGKGLSEFGEIQQNNSLSASQLSINQNDNQMISTRNKQQNSQNKVSNILLLAQDKEQLNENKQEEGNELDEFTDIKSEKLESSFMSTKRQQINQNQFDFKVQQQDKHYDDLQNFQEYKQSSSLNASMLSEQPINKQNIGGLRQTQEQQKPLRISPIQTKDEEKILDDLDGFDDFVSEKMNDSILSSSNNQDQMQVTHKQQQNKPLQYQGEDIDNFNDYESEKNNQSILSETNEVIFQQNQNQQINQKQQGNDFDDFQDNLSEGSALNSSMMSNN